MNKKDINQLMKNFSIEDIEKNMFYYYLVNNKIDYSHSKIFNEYFYKSDFNEIYNLKTFNLNNIRELVNILELLIPVYDKSINGAYFTLPYIVDFIIKEISPKENNKNFDPACGSGAFLVGLTEYYRNNFNKSIKNILKENVYGADILNYNVRRSKLVLALLGLTSNEIIEDSDLNIICIDSLKSYIEFKGFYFNDSLLNSFDNVVGNPPYVKFQDLTEDTRLFLNEKWESIRSGTFNLYFAFFELGYKILSKSGKLGFITPNNYFTSLSAESLRVFLQNNLAIYKVVDFNHRKVFDAQTYTSLTFLSKSPIEKIEYDRINSSQECQEFLNNLQFSNNYISNLNPKKWRLLKNEEQYNILTIENIGTPVNNLFNINVGIATLKDELYFIDATDQRNGYYLKKFDGKTFEIEKEITRPIYKISDFKHNEDFIKNRRRIIFPYKIENKTAIPLSIDELRDKFPLSFLYMSNIKDELDKRDKGKNVKPFYAYGRSQGLAKYGVKIVTPTFSKKPRFHYLESKDAFFCNGYGLFYPDNNSASLFEDINLLLDVSNVDALLKILNSYIMHYYVSKTSVSIEGNYPCYQKNFIEKFSIPYFNKEEIQFLKIEKNPDLINSFLIDKYQLKLETQNLEW